MKSVPVHNMSPSGDFISYSLTLHELKLIPFERAASWWPPLQDSILLTGLAQEGGRGWGGEAYAFHLIWRLDPIKYLSWTTSATAMQFLFLYFLPPSFPAFCLLKFYVKLMGFWLEIMIPPIPHFTSTRMMGSSTFAHWTMEFFVGYNIPLYTSKSLPQREGHRLAFKKTL